MGFGRRNWVCGGLGGQTCAAEALQGPPREGRLRRALASLAAGKAGRRPCQSEARGHTAKSSLTGVCGFSPVTSSCPWRRSSRSACASLSPHNLLLLGLYCGVSGVSLVSGEGRLPIHRARCGWTVHPSLKNFITCPGCPWKRPRPLRWAVGTRRWLS